MTPSGKIMHNTKLLFLQPIAARYGDLEICQLIIGQTHNVNPADMQSVTPLHYAAYYGHSNVYSYILENIEPRTFKNGKITYNSLDPYDSLCEWTPLHLADRNGHYNEIYQIFQKFQKTRKGQSKKPSGELNNTRADVLEELEILNVSLQ